MRLMTVFFTLAAMTVATAIVSPCPPTPQRPSPAEATLARVAAYDALLDALWLEEIPEDLPGRTAAASAVERLGERIMELTRQAGSVTDEAGRAQLDDALLRFDRQLEQTLQRSRAVAVYALRRSQGARKPTWGVALAEAGVPILPPAYQFEGKVSAKPELWVEQGKSAHLQLVALSLRGRLPPVEARLQAPLRGPEGDLPPETVTFAPVRWRQGPEDGSARTDLLTDGRREPPESEARVLMLTVAIPEEARPGVYETRILLSAENREGAQLALQIAVTASPSAERGAQTG